MAFSKLYDLIKTMIFNISECIKLSPNVWCYHWYALPFCEKNTASFATDMLQFQEKKKKGQSRDDWKFP